MSLKNRRKFASLAVAGCFLLGLTSCDPITIHITTDGVNLVANNDDKDSGLIDNQDGDQTEADENNDENQNGSEENNDDQNDSNQNQDEVGNNNKDDDQNQNGSNQNQTGSTGNNQNGSNQNQGGNNGNQSEQTGNQQVVNQKVVYVSKSNGKDSSSYGTSSKPYASLSYALSKNAGNIIEVQDGEFDRIEITESASGTKDSPTVLRAAKGSQVKIKGSSSHAAIYLHNVSNIRIEGIETVGGKYGIRYISDTDTNSKSLDNITIKNCHVHGVRGTHGICVYGENDVTPITNLTIDGNEVDDCECGSSESVVVNGNIDGFLICNNIVHDNNNIGIDMIGFEGTAKHKTTTNDVNPYENDFVRNGVCRDNFVYNISTVGNSAYYNSKKKEYELCAGGIYVDGGQDIKIYNNLIYKCNIGIEVATEHKPKDNELFKVSGIDVYDNIISNSDGFAGLCFGGYEGDRGYTEACNFYNNTLINNESQIVVQRSKNNKLYNNLIVGGENCVEYSDDCKDDDLENSNSFYSNAFAVVGDKDTFKESYGTWYTSKSKVIDGIKSKLSGIGSRYIPSDEILAIYNSLLKK